MLIVAHCAGPIRQLDRSALLSSNMVVQNQLLAFSLAIFNPSNLLWVTTAAPGRTTRSPWLALTDKHHAV
jgi:hypothetical protein